MTLHLRLALQDVVTLPRSGRKDFALEPTEEGNRRCVLWEVFDAVSEKKMSEPHGSVKCQMN